MDDHGVCPHCGYCKCCGRINGVQPYNPYKYYPLYPAQPSPYTITWGGTGQPTNIYIKQED